MKYISLYELNQKIKQVLSSELDATYWIVAEIGEMRVGQNGHCYLDLVEKNDKYLYAKIRATIWCNTYRKLGSWFESITGETLRDGLKILTQVEVKFHHLYGLSLNVRDIDAQYTLGERAMKRQQVINQLVEDGVFDMNKSLALSEVPQKLAVISSPAAAGLGDFVDQLNINRFGYQFHVELFKAKMQGNEAAESIIQALHRIFELHEHQPTFDCVVIIRGGGAQVDLDCFDSYDLSAHVAQFPLPVITGIGHERDETVIDLIAHTRKKTPTAVAEFLVDQLNAFETQLDEISRSLVHVTERVLSDEQHKLERLTSSLNVSVVSRVINESLQIDQHKNTLEKAAKNLLSEGGHELNQLRTTLIKESNDLVKEQIRYISSTEKLLQFLDPEAILSRGFTLTYVNGTPIHLLDNLEPGSELLTKTHQSTYLSILDTTIPTEDA